MEDRLSDLPDFLLLHILELASIRTKAAVQTSILSKRWKNLWKLLPTLILNSKEFSTVTSFDRFVSRFLSQRDGSIAVNNLEIECGGCSEEGVLERLVDYAISRNLQRSTIISSYFPSNLFASRSLTCLKISAKIRDGKIFLPESLDLPALTNLHLRRVNFRVGADGRIAEPFSCYQKLNSLKIKDCSRTDCLELCISNVTLVHLTVCGLRVSTVLYTPNLRTFVLRGYLHHLVAGPQNHLPLIEEAVLGIEWFHAPADPEIRRFAPRLLSTLQMLDNATALKLSSNVIDVLSFIPLPWVHIQPPRFRNLKSLILQRYAEWSPPIRKRAINYWIQNSAFIEPTVLLFSRYHGKLQIGNHHINSLDKEK